jgi:alpha-tubulin suppressor-like RCC1 family protein
MRHFRLSSLVQRTLISILALVFCLGLLLPAAVPVGAAITPTVTLTSSDTDNTTVFGASVTFLAHVSNDATGHIVFKDNNTAISGSLPLSSGNAFISTTTLSVGSHPIKAFYTSDNASKFNNSESNTINHLVKSATQASTITVLASNDNPSNDGSVTFTAVIAPHAAGTMAGSVAFKDGTATLGTDTTIVDGAASITKSDMTLGGHSVTAVFSGNDSYTGSASAALVQYIYPSDEGFAWAWGDNSQGQLGNNATTDQNNPVLVNDPDNPTSTSINEFEYVEALSAGGLHSLAIAGSAVFAWGDNSKGQLGVGSTNTPKRYPTEVDLPGEFSDPISISAGYQHSLFLDSEGQVFACGDNSKGQLGTGNNTLYNAPEKVAGLDGVKIVAISAGYQHSLAIDSTAQVWAWGLNDHGQLGNNSTRDTNTPVEVSGLNNVIAIAAGKYHSLALKSDGTVWAWGYNSTGQLGDGSDDDSSTPVQVEDLGEVIAIAAGDEHSLALDSDLTVWAWGSNENGQLGDDSNDDSDIPVQVEGFEGGEANLEDIKAISAGSQHSLALDESGNVFVWGDNSNGQLGNNYSSTDLEYSEIPVLTSEFDLDSDTRAAYIAAGGKHSLVVYNNDLYISTDSLLDGIDGEDYSVTLKAARGNTDSDEDFEWEEVNEDWSVDFLDDAGLELDEDIGKITGECDGEGEYNITIRVTGENGDSAIKRFTLVVDDGSLHITTDSLSDGDIKASYSQALSVSGGTPPYTWSLASGRLPSGLAFRTNGQINGEPRKSGIFTFIVKVTDSQNYTASKNFMIKINPRVRLITPKIRFGEVGTNFPVWSPVATGGDGNYTWSISEGSLPPGLVLDESVGSITGTPLESGNFLITLKVNDELGGSARKAFRFRIFKALNLDTEILPSADIGISYRAALKTSGGSGKYTWSITEGELPPGFSLTRNVIKGLVQDDVSGDYFFTVQVNDALGSITKELQLTINPPLEITDSGIPETSTIEDEWFYQVGATGGTGIYRLSATGRLPKGIKIKAVTNDDSLPMYVISGTLTKAGTYQFTFKATDSLNKSVTRTYITTIKNPEE